jgi:hypothetical protein
MWYYVRGEFVEENIAGKPALENFNWIETFVHPSLEMLEKWMQERKIVGGIVSGERVGVMMLEASSNEEVGKMMRSLPFWGALKWTISPVQSFRSAIEQDKEAFKQARAMMGKQ